MSTHSTIWLKNNDNTFTGIYCHNDGYIENNGKILLMYYNDLFSVKSLIDLGSLSSLQKYLSTTLNHSFDNPAKDVTIAYHRDRGEDFCQYKNIDIKDLPKYYEEYNYLFIDGEWQYIKSDETNFKKLKDAIKNCKV